MKVGYPLVAHRDHVFDMSDACGTQPRGAICSPPSTTAHSTSSSPAEHRRDDSRARIVSSRSRSGSLCVGWASMCRSSPEWWRWISTRRRASTRSTRTDGGWPRGSAVRGAHVAGGASPLGARAAQLRRRLRQRCGRRPQLGDRHRTRRPHHRLHRGEPHQPQSPSSPRPPATDPAPKPLGQLCSRCCDGAASRSTTVAAYF